jgi:hypothetical protein
VSVVHDRQREPGVGTLRQHVIRAASRHCELSTAEREVRGVAVLEIIDQLRWYAQLRGQVEHLHLVIRAAPEVPVRRHHGAAGNVVRHDHAIRLQRTDLLELAG